tara:strand:- start:101 stop:1330 length:1230 start_codon:yes stop_codon:yes gene_type:complete
MSGGIPIRLVRIDGELIELLATDFALDVDRGVSGQALWFTGSQRFAFDTNTNAATIIINGIVTDDEAVPSTPEKAATASIDFSINQEDVANNNVGSGLDNPYKLAHNIAVGGHPAYTVSTALHNIELKATDGTVYRIYMIENSSSTGGYDGGSGRHFFTIYNGTTGTAYTPAQIAANFKAAVDAIIGNQFVTALKTSIHTGIANSVVEITQYVAGSNGNNDYPVTNINNNQTDERKQLYHMLPFSGGSAASTTGGGKSAGDKVMDLYSIANNSNDPGLGSLGSIASNSVLNAIMSFASDFVTGGTGGAFDTTNGDYIIGIQIPFDSMINASGSEKYKSVNFFMPTGVSYYPHNKMSDNAIDATTQFEQEFFGTNYTGIKGTIQKITFTKFAGEPVYGFNLIFAPIDWII